MALARVVSWLSDRESIRGILYLGLGVVGSQLVTLCAMPVITRLYAPSALGTMGIFAAVLAILAPVAALTFPASIVIAESDQDVRGIARLSLGLAVLISIAVGTLGSLVRLEGFQSDGLNHSWLAWLLALAMFLSVCQQLAEQLFLRLKIFGGLSSASLIQSLLSNSAKIAVGGVIPTPASLIVITALSAGAHAVLLWFLGVRRWLRSTYSVRTSVWNLVNKYADFPLYRAPQILINSVSHSFPALLLGTFFGPTSVGLFALAKTVMDAPSILIGKSIGDVTYTKLAHTDKRSAEFATLIRKGTLVLAGAGLVPLIVVLVAGPFLFSLVFGREWHEAGVYAQWVAVTSYFFLIARPSVAAIAVLKLQRKLLVVEICSVVFRVGFFVGAFKLFGSSVSAVAGFAVASAIIYMSIIFMVLVAANGHREAS